MGAAAQKPLLWLDPWRDPDALVRWLEARDWGERVAWTGDEIMNMGVLLQYARDFHNDQCAGQAVAVLQPAVRDGHAELRGEINQGAMSPTWFRLLSLALIGKALPGHELGRAPRRFVRCPGMQLWG